MTEVCEGVILEVGSTVEEFVTVALITGHVVFPSSLKRRQLESNCTRCVVCITLQSITKLTIFPLKIFEPGMLLFTLRTYGALEFLRLNVKSLAAALLYFLKKIFEPRHPKNQEDRIFNEQVQKRQKMNHSETSLRPPKASVGKRLSAFSTVNEVTKSHPRFKCLLSFRFSTHDHRLS